MAALTGVMHADFSEFRVAMEMAIKKLKEMEAAGKEAGKGVEGGIEDVTVAAKDSANTLGEMGQALAGAFTINALKNFLGEVIDLTAEIKRMSVQTGLSVEEVQKLQAVAAQTGTPIDALSKSLLTMQERLGADDRTGINGALKKLGINAKEFDGQTLYQQLETVSGALKNITSDTEKAAIQREIFGGGWKQAAPAIQADLQAIGDSTAKMSETTVESFDWMATVVSKFWTDFKGAAATAISDTVNVLTLNPFAELESNMDGVREKLIQATAGFDKYKDAQAGVVVGSIEYNDIIRKSNDLIAEQIAKNKPLWDATQELNSAGRTWAETVRGMNAETVTNIKAGLEAGVTQKSLAVYYHATATEVRAVSEALRAEERAIEATNKLWTEYNATIVSQTGTATDAVIQGIERWASETARIMREAGADTTEFYEALAEVTHAQINDVLIDWEALGVNSQALYARNLDQIADKAEATFAYMTDHSSQFSMATIQQFGETAQAARDAANNWQESWVEAGATATAAVEKTTQAVTSLQTQVGGGPGGGTVDTSGITLLAPLADIMAKYNATYGSGIGDLAGRPQIGNGEDILTYALRSGMASRAGGGFNAPNISNVFNIVDTESAIAKRVSDTIASQIQRGSLVN